MKSFITISGLFLSSSVALACPDLTGTYSLVKTTSKDGTEVYPVGRKRIKVEQGPKCDWIKIIAYEKTVGGPELEVRTDRYVVDGKPHILPETDDVVSESFSASDTAFNGTLYFRMNPNEAPVLVGTDVISLDDDGYFYRVMDGGAAKSEYFTVRDK